MANVAAMQKTIFSSANSALADWLKTAREEQGLTMRELAKKLDVAHSFVARVEQQERRLDVVEFVEYCRQLKLDPMVGLQLVVDTTNKANK